MPDCDICGGLRINGRPIRQTRSGEWIEVDARKRDRLTVENACRDCAKEKLNA